MFLSCLHVNSKKDFDTAVKELSAMYRLPYKARGITIDSCLITTGGLVYKYHVDINSREYKLWQWSQRKTMILESKKSLKQKNGSDRQEKSQLSV